MVAAVGVLAVLGVSALAVQALVSGGGGASSPEAAVERLADAITAEDPVALAAALDPAEAESLGDLLADIEARAQETGFAPDGDSFAGIDLTAEGLEYEAEEMGDGLAHVDIVDGRVGYSIDPGQLGGETREVLGDDAARSSGEIDLDEVSGQDLSLVTVRRDGGWYVSIAHSLADSMVEAFDLPPADGDEDLDRSDPAADPEAAVTELIRALASGDVEGLAGHLAGDTGSVLRPYRDAVEEVLGAGTFAVDDVDVDDAEELEGGARRVRIRGAEGTFSVDGEEVGWELDGLCLRFDGLDDLFQSQLDELDEEDFVEGPYGSDQLFDAMAEELCALLEDGFLGRAVDADGPSVVVVEERGGWVVSPFETALLAVRDLLPNLDRDTIYLLAGRPDLIAPQGEAPFGEVFEVDLGELGVATRTVTATRDLELVVSVADEAGYATLVGPDGEEPEYADDGYLVEEGTEYRLVVEGGGLFAGGSGSGTGDTVELALGEVARDDLGEVSLAGTIEGTLTAAEPIRRTSFTLDHEVRAEVVVDADVFVDVYEEGEVTCSDGERCTFEPGADYELVVQRSYGDSLEDLDYEVSFEVAADPPPGSADDATIDGGTSVSGELTGEDDSAFHQLVIPDGVDVLITVEADDPGEDVDIYVGDEAFADSGDESFELSGPVDEDVEVYLFSEGPTGYQITLEPA